MTMTSETQSWPFATTPNQTRRGAAAKARPARIPVTRVEHFMLSDLSSEARAKLVNDTYRISLTYFADEDRDNFEHDFFSGDPTWVFLYYGADGALCGFSSLSLLRVSHEGKEHGVFKGMICVDTRYKLVGRARLPTVIEALRFKLRNPWMPIAYMGMAASPSVYQLLASSVPRIYPSRNEETPETIKALMLKTLEMRGHACVDEDRLLVPATPRLANPERIRESRKLRADPDAGFFMERNPRFDEFYMLMWVPLDLGNLAVALAKTVGRYLFG